MKLAKGKCHPIEGRTKNVRGKNVERQKDLQQKLVKSVSQDAPAEFSQKKNAVKKAKLLPYQPEIQRYQGSEQRYERYRPQTEVLQLHSRMHVR
jgi:hypothetical protein